MAKKKSGISPRYDDPRRPHQGITPHYVDTSILHKWAVILYMIDGTEVTSICYAATFEEAEESSLTQAGVRDCVVLRPPLR